jgi:hypothetical protein
MLVHVDHVVLLCGSRQTARLLLQFAAAAHAKIGAETTACIQGLRR